MELFLSKIYTCRYIPYVLTCERPIVYIQLIKHKLNNIIFKILLYKMQQCCCISTQDENENLSSGLSCDQEECENKEKIENKSKNKISFIVKVKTEICKYWAIEDYCPYGQQCAFAHGQHEIRQKTHVPHNYKTQVCKNYITIGYCCYGERCQFKHPEKKGNQLPCITYQNLLNNMGNTFFKQKLIKNQKRSKGLPYKL
ncbi:unnamed protein product (macronuclear) [Paramecium tetraurelia]|uniref:C3H1-type domain-containing protein n=1 Tax=Paramecium tetraurelia TaxID=5888 RepID=A0DQF1_PARTE|nr:uncharacterized protein GSPATT00002668001 [Paramecium tetraurelia]CAK85268.1 unnamed protein product [Paramecium tetraurelia]|eukprot:XP_001452665.1 hypothetical protein (macronuclear) [Paramecium tetraurelia strain d4-2]